MTFSAVPKSEWDICGGVALVEAVGKVYRRLDGKPCCFNRPSPRIKAGAAAGPAPLVDELQSCLTVLGFTGVVGRHGGDRGPRQGNA